MKLDTKSVYETWHQISSNLFSTASRNENTHNMKLLYRRGGGGGIGGDLHQWQHAQPVAGAVGNGGPVVAARARRRLRHDGWDDGRSTTGRPAAEARWLGRRMRWQPRCMGRWWLRLNGARARRRTSVGRWLRSSSERWARLDGVRSSWRRASDWQAATGGWGSLCVWN
jgi:hypothetical protein